MTILNGTNTTLQVNSEAVTPPAFTDPTDLTGIIAWWERDNFVKSGSDITQWTDSINTYHLTNSSGSNEPQDTGSGTTFSGATQYMDTAASFQTALSSVSQFTYFGKVTTGTIVQANSHFGLSGAWGPSADEIQGIYFSATPATRFYLDGTNPVEYTTALASSTTYYWVLTYSTGSLKLYWNGTLIDTDTNTTGTRDLSNTVGIGQAGGSAITGLRTVHYQTMGFSTTDISGTQIDDLNTYLSTY